MVEQPLLIYTTFPDEETALAIGEALVRDRLIACLNVLPGLRSVYRWQDGIERGREVVGLLKTREGRREALGSIFGREGLEAMAVLARRPGDRIAKRVCE